MKTYTPDDLRALDAKCAEAVYRYRRFIVERAIDTGYYLEPESNTDTPGWHDAPEGTEPAKEALWQVPRFTTDPAAGETLLDALTASDDKVEIVSRQKKGGVQYAVHPNYMASGDSHLVKRPGNAEGPTRLIALTLAAIAACEEKGDD